MNVIKNIYGTYVYIVQYRMIDETSPCAFDDMEDGIVVFDSLMKAKICLRNKYEQFIEEVCSLYSEEEIRDNYIGPISYYISVDNNIWDGIIKKHRIL